MMIELNHIRKAFGSRVILDDLDLKISDGEFVYITGSSGSGKSTLLNLLALFDTFDSGSYLLDGVEMQEKKTEYAQIRNRCFGFVFQAYCLLEALTVYENIRLPLLYSGEVMPDTEERILSYVGTLGLDEVLHAPVKNLSGGEKQRVAFARAIIQNPRYLFCDEPTGNLDESNSRVLLSLLHEANQKGTAVIVVTHDRELVKNNGGTVYEIQGKKLFRVSP